MLNPRRNISLRLASQLFDCILFLHSSVLPNAHTQAPLVHAEAQWIPGMLPEILWPLPAVDSTRAGRT